MTDTAKQPTTEREEIEMLLPWYVTGNLDDSDRDLVEAYLGRHPEMAAQLELIRDEQHQTIVANEAIPAMSAGAADRLLDSVAASDRPARQVSSAASPGIVDRIKEFFTAPTAGAVQWAAAAAAVMLLVQAVAIGSLVSSDKQGQNYQTASGEKVKVTDGTFALVRFNDAASAGDISKALSDSGAVIVDGPAANGFFKVRLAKQKLEDAERARRIATIRSRRDVFLLVTPTQK